MGHRHKAPPFSVIPFIWPDIIVKTRQDHLERHVLNSLIHSDQLLDIFSDMLW